MKYQKLILTYFSLLLVTVLVGCGTPPDSKPTGEDSTPAAEEKSAQPAESESKHPDETNKDDTPVEQISSTTPFSDKVAEIPGTIEAENFDEGAAGVAYADQEEENQGDQDYRGVTQVDIEKRDDASGGFGVGWTKKDEWLIYTVQVKEAGVYNLEVPVACDKPGGTFHLEFDGKDVTGPISIPDTGGWTTLQTISKEGINLEAGQQTMKLVMDTEGEVGSTGDIDCLIFTAASEK